MRYALDVRADDVFWNVADPGWAYGLWYGIVGPLLVGHAMLLRTERFEPADAYAVIAEHGVTNLAAAPTAFRTLRAMGLPVGFREKSRLRVISSAGEPLDPDLFEWSAQELGAPIHDHYGQSEVGMVAGFPHADELAREPVPRSMGVALPGFRLTILDGDGHEARSGEDGDLAIDLGASPLCWFRGYYADPGRTAERIRDGRYYLTGDAARRDEAGLLRFASRADDVITSSGYRIGPFEVEATLLTHPAVSDVAVIGTPDELRGEAVTAFVVTSHEVEGTDDLVGELQDFVKGRLARHLYPRRICFIESLPRTPSGKVRRAALREEWRKLQAAADQAG